VPDGYDAVVVGAGCSGSVFAARVASRGFRVLLVERKREDEIGEDCIDFVENEGFELSSIEPPKSPESLGHILRVDIVSPDGSTRMPIVDFPYQIIDRRLLAQRLLKRAKDAGAEVLTQCIATGVEIDNGYAVAVNTDRGKFRTKLVIGASGLDRVVCRDLPKGMGIPRRIRTVDHTCIYRETRELDPSFTWHGPDVGVLEYHVGRYGGYSWICAIGDGVVDIGSAVQDREGFPDPKELVYGFVRSTPGIGEKVLRRSGGRIPTRRPLNTMVASGLMILGDSACQAIPIIGRGIGGAMIGATYAADAASFALEAGDVSRRGLWSYNYNYMRDRGAHMAALDCMRIFLQRLKLKEFAWAISKGIIDERSVKAAIAGRFVPARIHAKLKGILKGLKDVSLISRFELAGNIADRVFDLYRQYPSEYYHPDFVEWSQQSQYLFEDISTV